MNYEKLFHMWHYLVLGANVLSCIDGILKEDNSQFWFSGMVSFAMLGVVTHKAQT